MNATVDWKPSPVWIGSVSDMRRAFPLERRASELVRGAIGS